MLEKDTKSREVLARSISFLIKNEGKEEKNEREMPHRRWSTLKCAVGIHAGLPAHNLVGSSRADVVVVGGGPDRVLTTL